jgi:hypothetical protein
MDRFAWCRAYLLARVAPDIAARAAGCSPGWARRTRRELEASGALEFSPRFRGSV